MPFNGSGVFQRVRNWVADATAGIKIRADYHDAEDDSFAAGLTNCITKDGQTLVTQNIPFNSKRVTGLADPVNPQDAATKSYADTRIAAGDSALVPPGALMDFAVPDAKVPAGWLICDGQAVDRTVYAALFAAIGTTWGAGNGSSTFNLPPLVSRFRRHRDNSTLAGAVGTLQAPANMAHSHTASGSGTTNAADRSLDHLHPGTTGTDYPDHSHTYSEAYDYTPGVRWFDTHNAATYRTNSTGGASVRHQHNFTTGGVDRSIDHLHAFSFTATVGSSGDANESRPYSATVLTCIKF